MSSLQEIKQQLILNADRNEDGQDKMAAGLAGIALGINNMLGIMKQSQLDMLEAMREKKSAPALAPAAASSGGGDGFGIPPGLFGAGAIIPVITALGASLAGLDDALRAIKLIEIGKNLNAGAVRLATRIDDFLGSMKVVAQKFDDFGRNLLKVVFIPEEGVKALGQQIYKIFGLGVDGKPVVGTSEAMKALYNPQKALANAIKPITTFFDDLVKPVTTFLDGAKEAGPMKAIGGLFSGIAGLTKFVPRIDFAALKAVIGSAEDATGIVGFFSSVFNFIKPLLKPFEFVLKTVMRPFTQILLSVVDFVTGFYQGFTSEDGTFFEKLTAGIEGGILGVIKGFTDAIDLIFIKLPAWIMEKLGFEGLADNLREFSLSELVEPAWEGIKNFFKNLFTDPSSTLRTATASTIDVVSDFTKSILRMILPDPGKSFDFLDPSSYVSRVIPDSIYEYAGMNPKTGKLITSIEPKAPADPDDFEGMSDIDKMRMGRGGPGVYYQDNSNNSSSSSSTPIVTGGGPNTNDAQDPLMADAAA